MNEIETKRKELESDVMEASGDNTEICSIRDLNEHILEGFDLGVEMARKEILEKLYKMQSDAQVDSEVISFLIENWEELKQSLGGGEK
jgi:hypothetical protein